ncbi:MAG: tetratricopeptide repeat protein [Verrucomicrobiota bacterium]
MIASNCRRSFLICALLCAMTLIAYWPVFDNNFINLDDYANVLKNPHMQGGLTWENVKWSFQAGYSGNWHPLTWLSHMLDVRLFGFDPRWHHLINLLFHIANSLLLFLLFQGLTGMTWRSAFVAAGFAVHPLHVESVAWVAERKDVLSTFFFLLTLLFYARFAREQKGGSIGQVASEAAIEDASQRPSSIFHLPSSSSYYLALFFFALGLMSKPMLVTLPFVLLLVDFWPLQRVELADKHAGLKTLRLLILEKIPFFILSVASSWVTIVAQTRGHAVYTTERLPLYTRFANAATSCLIYLGHAVWPVHLAIFYPYRSAANFRDCLQVAGAVVVLVAVSFYALSRIKRAPWFATGWFWFLGTLVPVIGIVQVGGQAMADRYTYIPLIGVFICLVWAGAGFFAVRHLSEKIPAAIGAVIVIACVAVTRQQVKYWRDTFTIANHALEVTINNPVAHDLIGQELGNEGRCEPAVEHFRAALEADPGFDMARYDLAVALTRCADALVAEGKIEEAIRNYQSALRTKPLPSTLNNLGLAFGQLGRREEAVAQYTEALRLEPDNSMVRFNLASALAGEGKGEAAEKQFAEALRLSPDPLRTLMDFARILADQGRRAEATAKLREAVRRYPTNAAANLELGVNLMMSGQTNEAPGYFSAALQLEPDLAEKNLRAAKAYMEQGRFDFARRCLWTVSWLKPDDAGAHENLGIFCLRHGQPADALTQFEDALRLRPDARSHCDLGLVLTILGRHREAASHYETAIQLNPDSTEALNALAWLLATTPDSQLRNGTRAVVLAGQACRLTDFKQPLLVSTLAAAYAEAGRFDDAVQTAGKAIALATAANQPNLASRNQELLEFYRAGITVAQSHSRPNK